VFRRNKSVVGLDLGRQVVKAVEISMDGPEPVITGFASAEFGESGRAEAIGEVFAKGKFGTKNVVTSVSGQSVVVRYITMPRMSDAELSQAILFESDKYLPFAAEDVQIDCQRLERNPPATGDGAATGDDQLGVVLAACRNDAVEEQIQEIKARGLAPIAIDVDVFALANAWELCGLSEAEVDETDGERAIALVDVGATCTSINVLCGGETCFSREIGIGGGDMTQAVARRLGLELAEAEEVKCAPDGRDAEVSRAIAPVLEDLMSEISLSLDYVENREGVSVDEVLLSGGGVMAPGAVAFIEQAVGRATRTWNPLEGLRVAEEQVDAEALEACAPSLAVAIGLAARVCAE
jgi:type IV pilus assembly protein PilM